MPPRSSPPRHLGLALVAALTACGTAPPGSADCLPVEEGDLSSRIMAVPFAGRSGPAQMTVVPRGSALWQAGRDAALAWAAADCPAFRRAADAMGYRAVTLRDRATRTRHWLLVEATEPSRYNGVFAFRHPDERDAARPLVVDAPHLGFDFTDDRAIRVYREIGAVALLQNTAHRCNLAACSGCSVVQSYPCGCERQSDAVHAVDHLYFAVYDGLEAARDDLHFEYHGASASAAVAGCAAGTVHLSQASGLRLSAADDDGTFPSRVWRALEARLGESCVCYHQRESGCLLNGFASTAGRRTNAEAAAATPVDDECTTSAPSLAGRFVHFEWVDVSPDDVIAALSSALDG